MQEHVAHSRFSTVRTRRGDAHCVSEQQLRSVMAVCVLQELEALRAEGKIRSYGLATWDVFRTPLDAATVRGQHNHMLGSHGVVSSSHSLCGQR